MADARTCPKCGGTVRPDAVDGLCARCLARFAFGEGSQKSGVGGQRSEDEVVELSAATTKAAQEPDMLLEAGEGRIGRYKLLERIGEGGFGVVYMAEQIEPIQRKVALKIIKAGMDTHAVIARFEAERQALALMDHPNIAKVLDAEATETGRPYFVMELVKGIPITNYCDQYRLSPIERLALFIQVCHAVQHAHQKGIIHRDIKPSNVLVTLHDGTPVPKVIDFGIAKALSQKLTEKTLFTGFGQMIGTPAYMSPEQAELSGLDVDTRSDIYSLGALLYELLTGVTPFDKETLAKAAFDEVRRMIRETEPLKPSTRLLTLGDRATEIAQHRHVEVTALNRVVRGDLDWIVMKCLEKDRRRRYDTASALASDLEDHLAHRPVTAAAPTTVYRLRKFVQRNRVATAFVLLLVVGTVVSVWQAVRATHAQAVAQRREAEARDSLWNSYLKEARASRRSGQPGHRFDALEATAKAAAIRPSIELRSEAASAMAMVDVRVAREWQLESAPTQLAVDSRFERYVYGDKQGNLTLRRMTDDQEIRTWPARTVPEQSSPDGRFLAGMKWNPGFLQVWEVETGRLVMEERLYEPGPIPDFHPQRPVIAIAAADGVVHLVDLESGQRRPSDSTNDHLGWLRFRPDGRQFAVAGRNPPNVRIYDFESGKLAVSLTHSNDLFRLDWSPDGRWLAGPCNDGCIYMWDLSRPDGESPRVLRGHDSRVFSVSFDPQGEFLVSQSWDGTSALWSWPLGNLVLKFEGTDTRLHFSRDGRFLGPILNLQTVRLMEINRARECWKLPADFGLDFGANQNNGIFSPDGRWLVFGGGAGVQCWDLKTRKRVWLESVGSVRYVTFRPDGAALLCLNRTDCWEWPWLQDSATGEPRLGLKRKVPVESNAGEYSADGRVLVVAELKGLRVVRTNQSESVLLPMPMCNFAAVSPDGRWAAAGNWTQPPLSKVWDLTDGREVFCLTNANASVKFSPDGRWLVMADGYFHHCLEVGTWRHVSEVRHLPGFPFDCLAITADSRWVALNNGRGRVQICELPSLRPVLWLDAASEFPVAFSVNDMLLTRRTGGRFCVWDLRRIREQLAPIGLGW